MLEDNTEKSDRTRTRKYIRHVTSERSGDALQRPAW